MIGLLKKVVWPCYFVEVNLNLNVKTCRTEIGAFSENVAMADRLLQSIETSSERVLIERKCIEME